MQWKSLEQAKTGSSPIAFISYSYDDADHEEWVIKLAGSLQLNGVKVEIDKWRKDIEPDLNIFMERGISEADFTIMVCTPEYARKADDGEGGVGKEGMILRPGRFDEIGRRKLIPVLRSGTKDSAIPRLAQGLWYVDFTAGDGNGFIRALEELLRKIHRTPKTRPPELGPNPFLGNTNSPRIQVFSTSSSSGSDDQPQAFENQSVWPRNSGLWKKFDGKKVAIVHGVWPLDTFNVADYPGIIAVSNFIQSSMSTTAGIFPARNSEFPNTIYRKNDSLAISFGGHASNPKLEGVFRRFKFEIEESKGAYILDSWSGEKFFSIPVQGRWSEYAIVKTGTYESLPTVFVAGVRAEGTVGAATSLIDEERYRKLFGPTEHRFWSQENPEWLIRFEMSHQEYGGIFVERSPE
jgi:TIR domain